VLIPIVGRGRAEDSWFVRGDVVRTKAFESLVHILQKPAQFDAPMRLHHDQTFTNERFERGDLEPGHFRNGPVPDEHGFLGRSRGGDHISMGCLKFERKISVFIIATRQSGQ
jgi:hypothetical protein